LVVPSMIVAGVAAAFVGRYDALTFLGLAAAILALTVTARNEKPPTEGGG